MSLHVPVCSLGHAAFPPRLLCPRCGSRDWHDEAVETGVLEQLADRGEVRLGAVRLATGPVVIARVEGDAQCGETVALDADGTVPVARPRR